MVTPQMHPMLMFLCGDYNDNKAQKIILENDLREAYAIVWGQCTLHSNIEAQLLCLAAKINQDVMKRIHYLPPEY